MRSEQKISALSGGFTGQLADRVRFGTALAALGDVDRDGFRDLAVGTPTDDDGAGNSGAAWVLFLGGDQRVRSQTKLSSSTGLLGGVLRTNHLFGSSLAGPGDLDGDGMPELLAGAIGDQVIVDGVTVTHGAVWALSLARDGSVQRLTKFADGTGGFTGELDDRDRFGSSLAVLGDQDGDGVPEIACGASGDDDYRPEHGAVWLLALDGIATLDFEHIDDHLPGLDGLALTPGIAFQRLLALGSEGANLGPALFDSTPGGPNQTSQDPDLLVGRGQILMLQDSLRGAQALPGLFDTPNDDADGGLLRFRFRSAIAPRAIALIDVDGHSPSAVRVRLIDRGGRSRIYDVPGGWTGDRVLDASPGVGRLDLDTLAPQPGWRGSATASESPGFRPARVVTLEVELEGSGAIDDLQFDPRP